MAEWTDLEIKWLKNNYPSLGKMECARILKRSESSIRWKTSELGLKQDRSSDFFNDWQKRAATSKIGKKRPEQALVMKNNHILGKLTRTPEQCQAISIRAKEWIKNNGHPRGALGMKHSKEVCEILSKKSIKMWEDKNSYVNSEEYKQIVSDRMSKLSAEGKMRKGYSRGRQGKRSDLNDRYFRSSWEANYARYLNFLIEQKQIFKWDYEVDVFWFYEIKRGCRSYTPDFKIWETEQSEPYYIEVKGWMDQKSQTKLNRMEKYYPNVKIVLIQKKEYNEIKRKLSKLISCWER